MVALPRSLPLFTALVGGLLVGASLAEAQRPPRQSVSGPAAPRERAVNEESVYRLLREQLTLLVEAQDSARARTGEYAASFGRSAEALVLAPRPGVTVTLEHASRAGWAATATHAALEGKSCVIWVGMVRPERRPVTRFDRNSGFDAEIVCDLVP